MPFQETEDTITIDKQEVESKTQKALGAVKSFLIKTISPKEWKRLGLEKSWKYFLPLIAMIALFLLNKLTYLLAFGVLIVAGVWLFRSRS